MLKKKLPEISVNKLCSSQIPCNCDCIDLETVAQ